MAFQKPSHTFTKIHLKGLRTNSLQLLFALSFTVFINTLGYAQELPKTKPVIKPQTTTDTTTVSIDSIIQPKPGVIVDSVKTDSIKPKSLLDAIVKYKGIS